MSQEIALGLWKSSRAGGFFCAGRIRDVLVVNRGFGCNQIPPGSYSRPHPDCLTGIVSWLHRYEQRDSHLLSGG